MRRDLQRAAQDRALQRRRYSYRADGVLVGIDDALRGAATMELDPVGRVTTVSSPASVERFGYDAAGNLADDGRSLSGTRLLRAGGTRFRYDAQGRLVERVKTRLSRKWEVWRYTWDAEDRLVGLTTPDGARWRYRYDAFGRRVGKELVSSSGSVESRTDFTWDGTTLVEESSTAGVLTWEYDGQRPLAQIASSSQPTDDPDSTFYAIVTDLVGAPTELVTDGGELAWQSRRSLWGAGPLDDPIPLGFPGQYRDPESGLSYNHFRYYDPLHARYVSPDPLGLAGGPNPAAYVPNPTGWVDPLGLSPGCCHGGHHGAQSGPVPERFARVLERVDETKSPFPGYKGGREWENDGRQGGQVLPRTTPSGQAITYQEWDVSPKVKGLPCDAERLVTGSDGSAYFTIDHYKHFTLVRSGE